jgi:predicted TIM-barrel fold metal-dependent hydrolase
MIVDSQVHLWRAESAERPWPPGGAERAHSDKPLSFETMLAMMDETGVDRLVIVPPSWEGDRNDYALEAAARYPDRFAVMGRITLDDPAAREQLSAWRQQQGMLGIRLTFTEHQGPWLDDGTADWFWPAAEKASVPVMLHPRGRMKRIGEIAERHPGLTVIIDHLGLNYKMAQENRREEGIAELVKLAPLQNVKVKLSSAPSYSHETFPFKDMSGFIERLLDSFGPERCFWGTDYTHSPEKCSYADRKRHFMETLPFLDGASKKLVMGDALLACLRWPKTPAAR